MVGFEEPQRRFRALIPVLLILLATNAAFGYGYLHYRAIAAEQEAALKRVESANADLQDALNRLHDRTQRSVQQLKLDNQELQARLSALEQRLAGIQPIPPKPLATTASPVLRAPPPAATEPLSPSVIQGALTGPSGPANFNAPGWVPDYFTNESGAVSGTPRRQQRRSHRRDFSVPGSFSESTAPGGSVRSRLTA